MMQALSRREIFKRFPFIDNQIAFAQQATYRTINQDDPDEVVYMTLFLDHLDAFHPQPKSLNEFCVLAYVAESKEDYENNFPVVVTDFFTRLKIEKIFIVTECQMDWKDFVFENEDKQKDFMNSVYHQTNGFGYEVLVKDLPTVLPMFFFKHPESPNINLIPSSGEIPVDLFMCKDGNLHLLFDKKIDDQLKTVAEETGLVMGSYEVCQVYKNIFFNF